MTKKIYWRGVLEWEHPTKIWIKEYKTGKKVYHAISETGYYDFKTEDKNEIDQWITKRFKM